MNLLTLGDSFTYGEELSDLNNAWPFLLGKKIDYNVMNFGAPGSSNDRMIRILLENLVENEVPVDMVIICWSFLNRTEMADEIGYYDIWPGATKYFQDHRVQAVKYISSYHSRRALYKKYLQQIILTQEFLKHRNIKYVMFDVLVNDYYKKQHDFPWTNYAKQIDQNFYIQFNQEGMGEWTSHCEKGPKGHFLDEGHRVVADRVYEHIRHLGWVS